MADFNSAVMTDAGAALLAKTMEGSAKIKFTRMKTGSGIYTEEEKKRSSLQDRIGMKELRQEIPFSNIELITEACVKLVALVSNGELTSGYYVNEIGIYAMDELHPEAEDILYSIAIANIADYLPPYNGLIPSTITEEYFATVANSLEVKIQTEAGAVALADDLKKVENPIFDQTEIRENIDSGEAIQLLFGKIKKWFSDLKPVAFSGLYEDLKDKPIIPETPGAIKNPYEIKANGKTYDGSSAVDVGTMGLEYGGTGATTASAARNNIGAAATTHMHSADQVNAGIFPLVRGGTGATTAVEARQKLGLRAAATQGIANNLTTTNDGYALDARQGKVIQGEIEELNSNLGDCVFVAEGSGADTTYYIQKGADTASKKLLGKVLKIEVGTFTSTAKLGIGINANVDIKDKIKNFQTLTSDNFCAMITSTSSHDPYKQSAAFGIANVKCEYDAMTGIARITSDWHNTDTTGYAHQSTYVSGILYCFK